MTEISSGRFVWYDLVTSDTKGGIAFYSRLIGWGTQDWTGGPEPYTMWTLNGTPLGGLVDLPENFEWPPHWIAYVATPDIDATCARVVDKGGSIHHGPIEIPTVGRFAIVADPQGAVLAVFTPATAGPGPDGPPVVGQFSWHELVTTDHKAAYNYYADLFGWEKGESMDMGELGIYQIYQRNGLPLGGMFNQPAEVPGPPFWLYYIRVPSVDESVKKVVELGGKILNGPMEVPGGDRIAQCMDPQGAAFALHSRPE